VDCHAHVFSPRAPAVAGARYRPGYSATLARWQASWRRAGITHGVLVQPSFFGTDNAEMVKALARDREHLRGVAVVAPDTDSAELRRLHGAGVRAIRLNLKGADRLAQYGSGAWPALYRRAHALGWHVEIHVDAGRFPEIAPAFEGSGVALVLDHFGTPGADASRWDATFDAVRSLAASREVWCKLSAPYRLEGADPRALAERWLAALGPRQLVWGSDWPFTRFEADNDYAKLRGALDTWLDASVAQAALWDNAARLYLFDPEAS
jgi:predicted TIM-barrel fold metal-dependent hydrolase